jgi:tetratricopeptide (TPR) repeat protein
VLEEAIPLAEAVGEPAALGSMLGNLAVSYYRAGELERTRELAQEHVEVFERSGTPWMAFALCNLADVLFHLGDWELARSHADRACRSSNPSSRPDSNAIPG